MVKALLFESFVLFPDNRRFDDAVRRTVPDVDNAVYSRRIGRSFGFGILFALNALCNVYLLPLSSGRHPAGRFCPCRVRMRFDFGNTFPVLEEMFP